MIMSFSIRRRIIAVHIIKESRWINAKKAGDRLGAEGLAEEGKVPLPMISGPVLNIFS